MRILIALCWSLIFSIPAYATPPYTKAQLTSEVNANWPDNTIGAITPALLRSTVIDIINSYFDFGGASSVACSGSNWVSAIASLADSVTCSQPSFNDLKGNATLNQIAQIASNSFLGNPTTSTASPTAFNIAGFAQKVTPANNDLLIIADSAAANGMKQITVGSLPNGGGGGGGVSSFNSQSGAVTTTAVTPLEQTLAGGNTQFALQNVPAYSDYCNATGTAAEVVPCNRMFPGVALYRPYPNQVVGPTTPFYATDPWGNSISCAGTNSACLQEFITATANNGWPAEAHCQGFLNPAGGGWSEPVGIFSTVGITVPPVQDWSFVADNTCSLNITSGAGSNSGLKMDSQGATTFVWDGKIVYFGSGCAVQLIPTSNTADGFAGIYGGLVRIKSPITAASSVLGTVCLTTTGASIIQQRLNFTEINSGNLAAYGVLVSGSHGLQESSIDIQQIHGSTGAAVAEGTTTGQNHQYNHWKVENIEAYGGRGIDTWGSYDKWDVTISAGGQGGSFTYGFVTESSANNNLFINMASGGGVKLDSNPSTNIWIGPQVGVACPAGNGSTLAFYGGVLKTC